jgi:ligand-binding sensor domain-containing protein
MNRYLKYFFVLIVCSNKVSAQLLPFKHYRSKDGLISDKVTAVIRDEKGLLWIGTDFGINWYDGNHFVKPDISGRNNQLYVTNFFKDNEKNIWILSFYNGIYKYQDGRFRNFLPDSSRLESNENTVFEMVQYDDEKFIVATDQGVYWFNGKNFSPFDQKNPRLYSQITSIGLIKNKWIVFGHAHGVFVYQKVNGRWIYSGEYYKGLSINKILEKNDQLWLATDKGLLFFTSPLHVIMQRPDSIFFNKILVSDITKNQETGEFWISGDKLYRMKEKMMTEYDNSNGLPVIPGKTYIDNEGIVWMCSARGLTKMAKQYYSFYDLRNGPSHSMINAMEYDDENHLWLGTYDGFGFKDEEKFMAYRTIRGKRIGYVSWIINTKAHGLLAGTHNGIVSIIKNDIRIKFPVQTSKAYDDEQGMIWAGTTVGKVYRVKENKLQELQLKPVLGDFIDAIYKDPLGYLWIGYRGNGVRKYEIHGDVCELVKEYSALTGYKDLRIRCCYADRKGHLLFGTRTNGLFIVSLKHNDQTWQINSSNGLSANWIRNINEDDQGLLYLATNQGLNVLSGSFDKPLIRKLNLLNEELGEETTSILPGQKKILVGTEEGLIEYYPQIDKNRTTTPPVYITEISVNGKQDSSLPAYLATAEKRLQTGDNFIAFEFAGINLLDETPVHYRYKLVGLEKDWVYSGERNFVSYHLAPGHYIFKAEARNSFGEWSNRCHFQLFYSDTVLEDRVVYFGHRYRRWNFSFSDLPLPGEAGFEA